MTWTEGNWLTAKVHIPADRNVVEYKYLVGQGGQFQWEGGCNHRFEITGACCLNDTFNHEAGTQMHDSHIEAHRPRRSTEPSTDPAGEEKNTWRHTCASMYLWDI